MNNEIISLLKNRKSTRAFLDKEIDFTIKEEILNATLRAPTAGNMMMYSIIEIDNIETKNKLVKTCDNQPFIAKSPWVLVFVADYQRWFNLFKYYNCDKIDTNKRLSLPKESDFIMAINDTMIAAQTTVIAAEALGIGSCYIGDIIENYEIHKEMFNLPKYTFPITMLCLGYPTEGQKNRKMLPRYDKKHIVFNEKYKEHTLEDFEDMYSSDYYKNINYMDGATNFAEHMYIKKYASSFSEEMRRSIKVALKNWE